MTAGPQTTSPRASLHDPLALLNLTAAAGEAEREIQTTVARFLAEHARPHIADWFTAGRFPRELVAGLGELGLFGMHLQGYGAAGTSATAYGLACLELEAVDSGLRSFVSVQGSLAMYSIHRFGSDAQRAEWLPRMVAGEAVGCFGLTEPDAGSDPGGMRTTARRAGGDWVLDGVKTWITNAPIADVATVWAHTDDGVRGFLVPTATPGLTTREIDRKLSLRASVTGELVLDGVRLPADAQLPGARGLSAPLACLNEARFGILFGVVGAARDCLVTALEYAGSRTQFGRPIAGFQLTQRKLADMTLATSTAMLLALHVGRLKDAGTVRPEHISAGKLNNVREALAVARGCRTILGGSGITGEYPPLRHALNLETVLTYEGTEEVHTLVLGQALTGLNAFR